MAIEARTYANSLVVNVTGRLDHDNADAVRTEVVSHIERHTTAGSTVVLDLSRLQYVSSAGLRCFMLASRQAKVQQARLVVAAAQPMVAEIFLISRFDMLIPIHRTVREALEAASADAAAAYDKAGGR
jgi:anti-sigma B factor antagonist